MDYEIFTNGDCNLRCTYCFEQEKKPKLVPLDSCKRYLRARFRHDAKNPLSKKEKKQRLLLIGGEPLLHTDLLDGIIQEFLSLAKTFAPQKIPRVVIISNCTMITKSQRVRDFFLRWKDCLSLTVSIDGLKEVHDRKRVDPQGRGSYDDTIAGYKWARDVIGNIHCGARATFSHETFNSYADGVISLFQQGFLKVKTGIVYEEPWGEGDIDMISRQFDRIIDYLISSGHYRDRIMSQLCEPMGNQRKFACDGCSSLLTLGLDSKIYGCHRRASIGPCPPVGQLEGDRITFDAAQFQTQILNTWQGLPAKCKTCGLGHLCNQCSRFACKDAAAYDICGWIQAMYLSRLKYSARLAERS